MSAPKRIHHINFVVRDLESAIGFYENVIGLPAFAVLDHDLRSKVGDTWFVLVCPYDETSVPAQHLKQHGEGFFLLSFGVEDLDKRLLQVASGDRGDIRQGILDWRIADAGTHFGAGLQFTEESS